jgi:hypothetical protein
LRQTKQIRHWSLMRILYYPSRSPFKRFQVITRGRSKVTKLRGNIQLAESPLRYPLESPKPLDALPRVKLFRIFRPERLDHSSSV